MNQPFDEGLKLERKLFLELMAGTQSAAQRYVFFAERQVWPTYRPAFEDPKLTEPLEFFDNQEVGSIIREVSPEINPAYNSPFWPETIPPQRSGPWRR